MFLITEEYIERPFMLNSKPLILPYPEDIKAIDKKAKRVRHVVLKGYRLTPTSPNVLDIIKKLSL